MFGKITVGQNVTNRLHSLYWAERSGSLQPGRSGAGAFGRSGRMPGHRAAIAFQVGRSGRHLGAAFNDVDDCSRVREGGQHVIWTPHPELYHHESVSRGRDHSWRRKLRAAREVAMMRRSLGHVMKRDLFCNPNLSYRKPDFSLRHAPRAKGLWLPG